MTRGTYRVSVVMPALDEEPNLAAAVEDVLQGFGKFNIAGEVIIVNDGSKDRTGAIADEYRDRFPRIRVIHHRSPRGIGASFMEGVQSAEGDAVVMFPGDGENDAGEILRYMPLIDHVDIVNPYICNPGKRSRWRRLLSFGFKTIINISFGMSFRCVTGTVLYRRAVLEDISAVSRGFFYQPELLIKATRRGYLFAEVPYFLKSRTGGASKSTTFISFINVVSSYLRTLAEVYTSGRQGTRVSPRSVTAGRMKEHP